MSLSLLFRIALISDNQLDKYFPCGNHLRKYYSEMDVFWSLFIVKPWNVLWTLERLRVLELVWLGKALGSSKTKDICCRIINRQACLEQKSMEGIFLDCILLSHFVRKSVWICRFTCHYFGPGSINCYCWCPCRLKGPGYCSRTVYQLNTWIGNSCKRHWVVASSCGWQQIGFSFQFLALLRTGFSVSC